MTSGLYPLPFQEPLPLSAIVRELDVLEMAGTEDAERMIVSLAADSREVLPGSLFVAIRGFAFDGHRYISEAVRSGAAAVICEALPEDNGSGAVYIRVADSRRALAAAARAFYRNASERIFLIGVTGTNGKTTTARLIADMLNSCGIPAGYIGTNLCRIAGRDISLDRTTPEAHELQALFRRMLDAGCQAAVMEVSSHALVLDRVSGLRFRCAVFTNLSMEHLDFHQTMAGYADAKQILFDQLDPEGFAVFNIDDPYASQMASRVAADKRFCCTLKPQRELTLRCGRNFSAAVSSRTLGSASVELHFPDAVHTVQTELPGMYNVMNLLEAAAVLSGMGIAPGHVAAVLGKPFRVEGRMERIWDTEKSRCAFVDYAHTPDALEKALSALGELKSSDARLVVVFGCGGNRDRLKRPEMGRIASEKADFVFLTSDNPRDENPEFILDEIECGMEGSNYRRITGREEAIREAAATLLPGDILLVAGKGHETYQEIAGIKHFFSDQEILRECLQNGSLMAPEKERA